MCKHLSFFRQNFKSFKTGWVARHKRVHPNPLFYEDMSPLHYLHLFLKFCPPCTLLPIGRYCTFVPPPPLRVRVRATVKHSAAFFHDESSITIEGIRKCNSGHHCFQPPPHCSFSGLVSSLIWLNGGGSTPSHLMCYFSYRETG